MKFIRLLSVALIAAPLFAQSLGNTGTIEGNVVDPSGASVAGANVSLHNVVTGYTQSTKSSTAGAFRLGNLPANRYHVEVKAPGFSDASQEVEIRSAVPVQLKIMLSVAAETTSVTVEGAADANGFFHPVGDHAQVSFVID